jgi:hypothetical protein
MFLERMPLCTDRITCTDYNVPITAEWPASRLVWTLEVNGRPLASAGNRIPVPLSPGWKPIISPTELQQINKGRKECFHFHRAQGCPTSGTRATSPIGEYREKNLVDYDKCLLNIVMLTLISHEWHKRHKQLRSPCILSVCSQTRLRHDLRNLWWMTLKYHWPGWCSTGPLARSPSCVENMKAVHVTGHVGPQSCDTPKIPTFSRQSAHRWRWGCQPYAPAAL